MSSPHTEDDLDADGAAVEEDVHASTRVLAEGDVHASTRVLAEEDVDASARIRGPWNREEDESLCALVLQFGPKKWSSIAEKIPGRIGKQCRERWLNHLDKSVKKNPWTKAEDSVLVETQKTIGNRWCEIAKLLPGRPENAVKNRFNSLINRGGKEREKRDLHKVAQSTASSPKQCGNVPAWSGQPFLEFQLIPSKNAAGILNTSTASSSAFSKMPNEPMVEPLLCIEIPSLLSEGVRVGNNTVIDGENTEHKMNLYTQQQQPPQAPTPALLESRQPQNLPNIAVMTILPPATGAMIETKRPSIVLNHDSLQLPQPPHDSKYRASPLGFTIMSLCVNDCEPLVVQAPVVAETTLVRRLSLPPKKAFKQKLPVYPVSNVQKSHEELVESTKALKKKIRLIA